MDGSRRPRRAALGLLLTAACNRHLVATEEPWNEIHEAPLREPWRQVGKQDAIRQGPRFVEAPVGSFSVDNRLAPPSSSWLTGEAKTAPSSRSPGASEVGTPAEWSSACGPKMAIRALRSARTDFASYLQMMHERIHPRFADGFLGSLASLPADHALHVQRTPKLITRVEMAVDESSGALMCVAIVQPSGNEDFDRGVTQAIREASGQGFGAPPKSIVSYDGKVHVVWEFHRNPEVACSNKNARPFLSTGPATP